MAKYIVTHSTFITGKEHVGIGGSVEMSEADKAHLDPDGNKLATPEVFEAMRAKTAAEVVIATKVEAKPKAPTPAPAHKGGGK